MITIHEYISCTKLIKHNKLKFGLWLGKPVDQSSNSSSRKHQMTESANNSDSQQIQQTPTDSKLNLATST